MLIILKQDDSCQVAQTTCTTNSLEIRYKDYSVLKKTLDLNTKSINSNSCIELIIYGTHGNEKEICKLTKPDIKDLSYFFKGKVCRLVLDACHSACHIPHFKEMLTDDGIILCHVGICQVNSIETKTGKDTYERWINGNKEGLKVCSDGIVPAIYTRKNNTLTYYECSKFEVDINHPFTGTEFKTYCLNLKSKGIKMVIKNHSDFDKI